MTRTSIAHRRSGAPSARADTRAVGSAGISGANDKIKEAVAEYNAALQTTIETATADLTAAQDAAAALRSALDGAVDADGNPVDLSSLDEIDTLLAKVIGDTAWGSKIKGVSVSSQTFTIAAAHAATEGLVQVLAQKIGVDLADGVSQLAAGSVQLADGTDTLVDGASQLLDGATQLNDGLLQADGNMPALMAGIDQLATDGAQQFMASGLDTQMEYEELVTQVAAAAKRTENGALPIGAPEGAHVASAAYVFDIDGTQSAGLSPMALAGIAAGIFAAAGIGLAVAGRRR